MAERAIQLTPAEAFVLQELRSGREADLGSRPPEKRVLGNDFILRLITGEYLDPEIRRDGVSIINAIFENRLIVSGTDVPFRVWFKNCTFKNGVDFSYTKFGHDLSFEGSEFGSAPQKDQHPGEQDDVSAFFVGMKIDGTAVFSKTTFYVPADFTYVEVGADFIFDDVKYQSQTVADFENTSIRGPVFFRRDSFAAPLSVNDAKLLQLFIEDLVSGSLNLELKQARIDRNISIKNVALNSWKAEFLAANGEVRLDQVVPTGSVDLARSHFGNLTIAGFDAWLKLSPNTLNLEGFSFDGVDILDGRNSDFPAARMLDLINSESCPYSPQPYLELEKFLRAHGHDDKANEVYVSMRRRQRQNMAWMNRPWDWLLDKMLGYGKYAWRAALAAILMILLGVFVFTPDRMEWKNAKQAVVRYNRFWYSLDQFAPVIDLDAAKNWGPKDHSWIQNYAILHRIVGWILLPLIVGAITGIVK
jgi:hypothetical protein